MSTRVAAVVPNRDGAGLVGRCVRAATEAGADEVVVVDDGSTDGSEREAAAAGARVIRSPGRGFAAAVNRGVRATSTPYALILNSDCFVDPTAIDRLGETLDAWPGLALCGAGLREPDGSPARSHGRLFTLASALRVSVGVSRIPPRDARRLQPARFLPLACVLARRSAWDEVGGLDERYRFYFEDHDLCWRLAERRWGLAVCWDARAVHVGGGSSTARDPAGWFAQYAESCARYIHKRYPHAWPLWAAVWTPTALLRSVRWRLRGDPRWARAWRSAASAALRG